MRGVLRRHFPPSRSGGRAEGEGYSRMAAWEGDRGHRRGLRLSTELTWRKGGVTFLFTRETRGNSLKNTLRVEVYAPCKPKQKGLENLGL